MVRTGVQLVERLPECCLPVLKADLRLREEWRKMVGPLLPQSKMASLTDLGQRNSSSCYLQLYKFIPTGCACIPSRHYNERKCQDQDKDQEQDFLFDCSVQPLPSFV